MSQYFSMVFVSEDKIYMIQTLHEFHPWKNLICYNFQVYFILIVKF